VQQKQSVSTRSREDQVWVEEDKSSRNRKSGGFDSQQEKRLFVKTNRMQVKFSGDNTERENITLSAATSLGLGRGERSGTFLGRHL